MANTEQTPENVTPTTKPTSTKTKINRCIIVPYPKIVFFYPLMCVSFVCGILEIWARSKNPTFHSHLAGTLFIVFFLINVMVISFDFPGVKALAFFLVIIVVILGVLYLDSKYKILPGILAVARGLHKRLYASPTFYFSVSAILFVMIFGGILVNWLWNRWTIEPNRLLHKHGIFRELTEYPVIDLQLDKKINDVFEYMLLSSGTLTFRPNPNTPPIVLENVPRINAKERKIQKIIRELRVSPPQG